MYRLYMIYFFFFNDTATTEIYTLSLHDALPIWVAGPGQRVREGRTRRGRGGGPRTLPGRPRRRRGKRLRAPRQRAHQSRTQGRSTRRLREGDRPVRKARPQRDGRQSQARTYSAERVGPV